MLLNISTTYRPASDIGFIFHKHPARFQTIDLAVGKAHIFYPECSEEKACISLRSSSPKQLKYSPATLIL